MSFLLKIGTLCKRQEHKKKVPILKAWVSAPGPSHAAAAKIRVVLLHTKGIVQSYVSTIVIKCWHSFYNQKNANAKWMFPLVAVSSGMLNTSMPKKQVVSGQCLGKDNGFAMGFQVSIHLLLLLLLLLFLEKFCIQSLSKECVHRWVRVARTSQNSRKKLLKSAKLNKNYCIYRM